MSRFTQNTIDLTEGNPIGKLKIEKLLTLIESHPYQDRIHDELNLDNYKDDIIVIENIDSAFNAIKNANKEFEKIIAFAELKNIDLNLIEEAGEKYFEFRFEKCRIEDEQNENLLAEAVYDSKNTFLEEHKMSKYANHLYDEGFEGLVSYNVQYFKKLAATRKEYNRERSYRLLKDDDDKYFLRGITSSRYNEYGIDFTFFVTMIMLHIKMKELKGNNYRITFLSVNESKLNLIVRDSRIINIEHFGNVSLGINISTNELGSGSLNVTSILSIDKVDGDSVYLFPRARHNKYETKCEITHTVGLENVFKRLEEIEELFNAAEEFTKEVSDIKWIKTPDELRVKIQSKIEHPRSVFHGIKELKDIFNKPINNKINNLSQLLSMCGTAENLDIEFDLKDKLRYMISDIILYGSSK